MTREPIEVTRQDRIYCLKVSSDYHSEVCEECRFYPNCDHMTQDDMTELTIKDLETLEQEPTTKNDLPHCQHTDEEIAKSFIEDVETVEEQFPCGEQMDFPNTFDEFAKDYGFKDKDEVYTNGSELISVFRVKQWLEHISTTKNDLTGDCISREQAKVAIRDKFKDLPSRVEINTILNELPSVTPQFSSELEKNSKKLEKDFGELDCISRADALICLTGEFEDRQYEPSELVSIFSKRIKHLPSATPQEPQSFEWCETCKGYDQEKHCCHRWTKVIRNTVEEMKQEYVEREELDKIRAEIERQEKWLMDAGYNQYNVDIALDAIKLEVNKYKAENNS